MASFENIVAPSSGVFYLNKRRKKIHVRLHFPSHSESVRGLLFFTHGLHAHVNRAWSYIRLFDLLKEKGFAVVAHDNEGSGYSEANGPYGYFHNVFHVVDDSQAIVEIVRSGNPSIIDLALGKGAIDTDMVAKLAKVKYCVMGMSMGGLTSQLCFQRLVASGKDIPDGLVYFCPVLYLKPLPFHSITMELIRAGTVCIRTWQIPDVVIGVDRENTKMLCATQGGRDKLDLDYAKGLGSNSNVRWGQALALFQAASHLDLRTLKESKVLVFHDPEDVVVPFDNATLAVKHGGDTVEIVRCPDQGHLLFHSRDEDVVTAAETIEKWFLTKVQND